MILKIRDYPALRAILSKAFPGYRKHSVIVTLTDSVALTGGFWDGGSRSQYAAIGTNGHATHLPAPSNPFAMDPRNPPRVPVGDRLAVAETGTFRGKTATMHLFVHRDDLSAFGLPENL